MDIIKFKISKLHKVLNYELKFDDNTLVLIGENGSCKTTIIKMLFYTLSMQWGKLSKYNFESITLSVNNDEIKISKKEILSFCAFDERFLRRLPPPIRREIMSIRDTEGGIPLTKLENLSKRYDIPMEFLLDGFDFEPSLFSENKSQKKDSHINSTINKLRSAVEDVHIIYLPTYRRIEQELKVVLEGRIDDGDYRNKRMHNSSKQRSYTELVEFGMDDVVEATDRSLTELKDYFRNSLNQMTLGYLGDVVDEKYNEVDINSLNDIDEETITSIMQRVDENILSASRKDKLRRSIEKIKNDGVDTLHDKVVCHYFNKLLSSHRELEVKEVRIRKFAAVCGKYLQNKNVSYDSSNFNFSITSNIEDQPIEFHQLSSGEKQIVSLFSHLYLDGQKKYFVLIDEPELSLSVKWQKQFLSDIKKGDFCSGIVAVTHSPFIFENELDVYAHAIEEFIKK